MINEEPQFNNNINTMFCVIVNWELCLMFCIKLAEYFISVVFNICSSNNLYITLSISL